MMATDESKSVQPTLSELLESKLIRCSHCVQEFQEPILLPCLHTFCATCVSQLSTHSGNNSSKLLKLPCPTCGSEVTIPESALAHHNMFLVHMCELHKLKEACTRLCEYCKFDRKKITATTLCLECRDDMCDPCARAHQRTRVTRDHKLAPYEQIRKGLYDHDVRKHQQATCNVHPGRQLVMFCETCSILICKDCMLDSHGEHKVSSVKALLPVYKEQLVRFQEGLENRIPAIADYSKFLETHNSNISSTKKEMTQVINNQANLLHQLIDQEKKQILQKLDQACKQESENVQEKCKVLGIAQLSLQKNLDFLSNLISYGNPEELLAVHTSVTGRMKQLVHMKPDGLTHRLLTSFKPGSATEQNIQIMLGQLSVSNVPFDQEDTPTNRLTIATVMPPVSNPPVLVSRFDAKLQSDKVDVWPTGLCVIDDHMVIVDRDNKKVKIFTPEGKLRTEFTGKEKDTLGSPFDATILLNSNIAVTDYRNEDVKIFDQSGNCILTISGHFRHPRGITTNKKGQLVIVDCHLHKILTFDPKTGKLVSSVTAHDNKGEQLLTDPYYIAETDVGDLVVTDQAAPNLKVFSPKGDLLAQYGTYGTSQDQVLQPHGVAVDRHGYILVADHHNSRIHLLLPDGRFSQFLLTKQDKLWHPVALAFNSQGHLVVAEALGNIKVFKYI